MLFALLFVAFQAPAQPVDPDLYLSFFQAAAHRTAETKTSIRPGYANGEPVPVAQVISLSVQDAIGITAEQAQSLIQLSALCEASVNTLATESSAVVFESRLQAADSDKPSDDIEAKLNAIEAKRVAIILGYVQQIKTSLGADAFRKADDYMRAHTSGGNFFPSSAIKKL